MKLSDNLKRIRKENNLSQEQLAEKLGVSRQAVSKWELGQSYPEMDKVLLICKLFNYNIDELMNENVKEVNETKQSKININKYIDDFFNFITKTVDMLSSMNFRQQIKCLIEQIVVIMFLLMIFGIIGAIGSSLISNIFAWTNSIYHIIYNIFQVIYTVLALAIGTAIFLHIFKIRYLDYYEFVKNEEINEDDNKDTTKNLNDNEKQKVILEKKEEKVIIRDPEHSQSKFLTGIVRIVLICIKLVVAWFAIWFAFSFIGLVSLLILSFLFVKAGLIFWGSLLGIIGAIIINFVILELCYNFIVSKKMKKGRTAILLISSMILAGISVGMIGIGVTQFNYIKDSEANSEIEDIYNEKMTDNLSINSWYNIQYVETDSNEVKISVKHSKYYITQYENENDTIRIHYNQDNAKVMEILRDCISDINNKEIKDYYNPTITVYSSKENIEKMQKNEKEKYNKSKDKKINDLYNKNEKLEEKIVDLEDTIEEKNDEIMELKEQIKDNNEI